MALLFLDPCIQLFSECDFKGDSAEVCGDYPVIPEDLKQFRVKSVKVPENVEVTFFKEEQYEDEHMTTDKHLECLDTPFNLSFLQLKQGGKYEFSKLAQSLKIRNL